MGLEQSKSFCCSIGGAAAGVVEDWRCWLLRAIRDDSRAREGCNQSGSIAVESEGEEIEVKGQKFWREWMRGELLFNEIVVEETEKADIRMKREKVEKWKRKENESVSETLKEINIVARFQWPRFDP